VAEPSALRTTVDFRTIEELAARCGHYCWVEHQLFVCTGWWAGAPAVTGPAPGAPAAALEAEIRVRLSTMSSWHGFLAGQWRDRLPVRAGVDAAALIVPPSAEVAEAFDLLRRAPGLQAVLAALVDPVLPALGLAYEREATAGAAASERPVLGLLDLAGPALPREIAGARALLGRAAADVAAAEIVAGTRRRLQPLLRADGGLFPAASAS